MYIWLAYRLHALPRATPVSWPAIHGQFGAGFRHVRQIKTTFLEALSGRARGVSGGQHLEKEGLVLHPSAPAVPRSDARRLGIG